MTQNTLEFALTSTDIEATTQLASELGGIVYADNRPDASKLPFAVLATVVTDDISRLEEIADIGLYVTCRRVIKPGAAAVYGLFPLIHHPDKTHQQSDAHWRDVHGPLALEHHIHMSHYVQLSVTQRLRGPEIDGFALCGFNSLSDLKERFFTTPDSVAVIRKDIENFANTKASPRRLIATPTAFGG
jgi:hypothetical protein